MLQKIKQFLETIFLKVLTTISLNLTYFIGIGLTAMIGKIVNKKFLSSVQKPSWQKTDYQTDLRKMF